MKFICLGYMDDRDWESIPESEQNALMDECFAYDDVLRKDGHFAGGEALDAPGKAVTLRFRNGKVTIADGPVAKVKEQLGGILVLEARDMDEAVRLMSKHPGVRFGPFEVRPAADLSAMVEKSRQRRRAAG